MQETELRDLGIHRISIPIPFPQAGGPVNAYAIELDDGFLLFDAGLGTPTARAALAEGLREAGFSFDGLRRIVLSHGHIDHFGAAAWAVEQAARPVPVSVHSEDADKVRASGPDWGPLLARHAASLLRLGLPPAALEGISAAVGDGVRLGRRLERVDDLHPGEVVPCRRVELRVLHMPGHTPGLCCLYDPAHRLLFSSDHLLERVSPNPLIELGRMDGPNRFRPLVAYFESVRRVRDLDVDLVLPGHAAPFRGHREVLDSLEVFYGRRREKLRGVLRRGPLTAYEAMRGLFPANRALDLYLMISETLGNLEVLEARGEVVREAGEGPIRFRLTG